MSIENSAKLIKEIADRKEADDYIEGLLKDPAMRADMERAERETVAPPPEQLETIAMEHLRQYYAKQAINGAVASQPTIWEETTQSLEITQQPSREIELER
jgi:hypothetical protein